MRVPRIARIGVLLVVSIAGCATGGTTPDGSPTEMYRTPTPTIDRTPTPTPGDRGTQTPSIGGTPGFPDWDPPEPFESFVIGDGNAGASEPHTYTVWNHDDEVRTIRLTIVENGSVIHARSYDFPPRGALEFTLAEAANYRVRVALVGRNRSRTMVDPIESFDCNAKGSNVVVTRNARILERAHSTLLACGPTTESA